METRECKVLQNLNKFDNFNMYELTLRRDNTYWSGLKHKVVLMHMEICIYFLACLNNFFMFGDCSAQSVPNL